MTTRAEMVTEFSMEGKTVDDIVRAVAEHTKNMAEEYDFTLCPSIKYDAQDKNPPKDFRWLVAFAIEGGSEGYYVHIGAMVFDKEKTLTKGPTANYEYIDFGFAKTYSADSAYALAREAQRFLTAMVWN